MRINPRLFRFCWIGLACSVGAASARASEADPAQWAQNLRAFSQLDPGALQTLKSFSPPKNSLLEGLLLDDVTGDGLPDTLLIYRVFPDVEMPKVGKNSVGRVVRIFANEGLAPTLLAQSDVLLFKPYDERLKKDPVLFIDTFKGGFTVKQQSKTGWVITQTSTWAYSAKDKTFILDKFSSQAAPSEAVKPAVVSLSRRQFGKVALKEFSAFETDRLLSLSAK